jgi:hypothetical protein
MTVVVVVVVVVVAMAISFYTNVPGLPPFFPSVFHSFLPSFLLFLPPVRGIFLGRVDAARVLPLFDLRAETVSYVLRSFPRPSFSPSFSSFIRHSASTTTFCQHNRHYRYSTNKHKGIK